MPLIQRNLFPSRPSPKKCDGPSVLRNSTNNNSLANNNNDSINNSRIIVNPNLSLYNSNDNDQSIINNIKARNKKDGKQFLRKSQSTSMISLLAITSNNNNSNQNHLVPFNKKNSLKTPIYDDNFNIINSDTSSDPNSLCSSSSSSMENNNQNMMISRRRILSRSRDALNSSSSCTTTSDDYQSFNHQQQDEDVWFNRTKLISDHVDEIISKWNQIDDEIWAKIICMERNRRVAKAYARTPILTINGFDLGFDGHRIGLNGFKNPMRDKKCQEIKNLIEDGIKIRMDDNGNLLMKRLTDVDVFIYRYDRMNDDMIIDKIEQRRKSIILFDMKQYHSDLLQQLHSPRSSSSIPNRRKIEQKCFCFISFGMAINNPTDQLLNTPVWCILINLVALEMLIKLLPPAPANNPISEDNFYSLPITISSSFHNKFTNNANGYPNQHQQPLSLSLLPPKLPPRDLMNKNPPLTLPEPDYEDDIKHNNNVIISKQQQKPSFPSNQDDDPYFYGLSAHVPKFPNNNQQQRSIPPPILPSSQFDPITMIQPINGRHNQNNNNDDNNEIYGINPSLLRKNTKFQPRITTNNSNSSSLRNIFSRKNKSTNINKDQNNNPRKH
ncbi:hypothetical protein DERP_013470 [Dermatophagoides pteronyssinus]|uniref:MH2 domain-containing protein n=1 Tax=Dermatophagoides pteronyssinus TaxID=6956 RepID=A0ABQ8JRP6_DERPT|nr:hypothetical protein DERP_013470 [Dermatophagoides pteronyssinus]